MADKRDVRSALRAYEEPSMLQSAWDEISGAFARYGRRSGAQRDASLAMLNQAVDPNTDPLIGAGMKALGLAGLVTHPLAFFPTREEWDQRLQAAGNDSRLGRSIGGFLSDLPSLIDPQMAAGGAATVAPAIFAGMMAKTADLNKLKQAEKLAELGHSADDIRDMTGWFKGADSKWRFEIDDSKSYYEPPGPGETFVNSKGIKHLPVNNVLGHKELFDAYPDLAEMRAYFMPRKNGAPVAGYSDKSDFVALSEDFGPNDGRKNLLHELQHAIQQREGFARGGRYDNPNYNELAGEVEARNVAARADMTQGQRDDLAPWSTQDVPTSQQVVSFGAGASHSAPLAAKMLNKADDVADAGIIAYHGSPHSFDKFDMSKIGTGEGNQAYMRGLYFAEKEDVAKGYRDDLSGFNKDGAPISPLDAEWEIAQAITQATSIPQRKADFISGNVADSIRHGFDTDKLRSDLIKQGDGSKAFSDAVDVALAAAGKYVNKPGSMYQVKINATPEEFLNWDIPLSQQPKNVQEALRGLDPSLFAVDTWASKLDGAKTKGRTVSYGPDNRTGEAAARAFEENLGGPEMAAEKLKAAGIKGVRYKDAGSRGTDGGTYNYVVFDDKLITILKKYGIPMTAGAGGAMMVAGQDMPPELASQMGGT